MRSPSRSRRDRLSQTTSAHRGRRDWLALARPRKRSPHFKWWERSRRRRSEVYTSVKARTLFGLKGGGMYWRKVKLVILLMAILWKRLWSFIRLCLSQHKKNEILLMSHRPLIALGIRTWSFRPCRRRVLGSPRFRPRLVFTRLYASLFPISSKSDSSHALH